MSLTLGTWIHNTQPYTKQFTAGRPYEHCVIPDFFEESSFRTLHDAYPPIETTPWDKYENPIEQKWTLNKFDKDSVFSTLISHLQSDDTVSLLKQISGIPTLEKDPYLHGAGIHYHPSNTKLDLHLDYSIHPISGKERRLNLVYFMNDHWDPQWNGALELWDHEDMTPKECITKIYPLPNTAILFKTNDISIHGLPEPILTPPGVGRKTFAIYYVSQPGENVINRPKAHFFPKPGQHVSDSLAALYSIRKTRRIEKEDMIRYFPDWNLNSLNE